MTFCFRQSLAARFGQLSVNEDRVARHNRFAKLHVVGAHEITDPVARFRELEQQHARELSICGVPRFYGNEMTANAATDKREVADNVENLVPDEFVRKTQRLFA